MAHNLIVHYFLHSRLEISRPFPAAASDIRRFHSDYYVDFLSSVCPEFLASSNSLSVSDRSVSFLPGVRRRIHRRRRQTQPPGRGYRHQLGRGVTPCKKVRGVWILLCQRYRFRDSGAAQGSQGRNTRREPKLNFLLEMK